MWRTVETVRSKVEWEAKRPEANGGLRAKGWLCSGNSGRPHARMILVFSPGKSDVRNEGKDKARKAFASGR